MGTDRDTESSVGAEISRRHRSKRERREIAEESMRPDTSAAVVARRHGVNANQVFHWRKLLREGGLDSKPSASQLMPVRITGFADESAQPVHTVSGAIHIELGRARIRVEGAADIETLRAVLEQLGR